MSTRKIIAWILLVAMVMTMLPNMVLAANPITGEYPAILTDVFSEMTNDIDGIHHGTDLDLTEVSNQEIPDFKNTSDVVADVDGAGSSVFYYKDKGTDTEHPEKISPMRRKQILTFVAESNVSDPAKGNFINESTPTKISKGAVEIAYLNVDKEPLIVDLESEEAKDFVTGTTANWDEAWIDLTTDVQRTNVNLKTFLTDNSVCDLKTGDPINTNKLTAADLFATGNKISFIIYNVIKGDFVGYIRVKITDNAGYTTVQDYAIVADGQYPSIAIETSTYKDDVGEYTLTPDALDPSVLKATTVAANTYISEDDFVTIMEDTEDNKAETEPDVLKHSYRWKKLDEDGLNATLKDIAEGKDSSYDGIDYQAEDIWAMDDIVVDKIAVSDKLITSEVESVKYTLKTFTNDELVNVVGSSIEGDTELTFAKDPLATDKVWNITSAPIVISDEGFNVLAITAVDKAGLKTTSRYYFFIDKTAPVAEFEYVELDKNVLSLFTDADIVTNRQQAVDMSASDDVVGINNVKVISGLEDATAGDVDSNKMYQYRLLATKAGAVAKDTDSDGINDVPDGYTDVVVDKKGNDLSGWNTWAGETETPIIDKEFDGIVQVRVQDRAGNWSPIVSIDENGNETIITDNTNPVIEVDEYALDTNGDATGYTQAEILGGTAANILDKTSRVTDVIDGVRENEVIHEITGDVAPWINDTAVLEVKITDEDLANEIRSSGLNKGQIKVEAEFNEYNQNKEIKIWNINGIDKEIVTDSFDLTADYLFGTDTDKDLTFYVEYEGTGVVDITVSVKDQADVNDADAFSTIYTTQLKVDKINPYIIYKGYDITDEDKEDLLKANTFKKDYEVRNMPWGPNSQVLEVVVKDDDITSVQSKTNFIKFNSDKPVILCDADFNEIESYIAGEHVIDLNDCEEIANEEYESNVGYRFFIIYEGTGIAKIEFYAEDSATEANVRDYPSVATAADLEPIEYDAMLRVDKIDPEIKNVALVQTGDDVNDTGWNLFTFNETNVDVNTRKQMKITFEIVDETTTTEQSGVNLQDEKLAGVDLMDVLAGYVENDKTHLYDNEATSYITDDVNEENVDPNIDYILLPVEAGAINGTGGYYDDPASASDEDIEALVAQYLDVEYNDNGDKCEWKKASWKDGGIVVPDEFQGAIVIRTIDRVGNVDYAYPITFVAESREPRIDFKPQNGYIWSQNNYGWSKRDYDYVEIRVKDDNEGKVDAWLENVYISVTDLEGNDITTSSTVKFAHKIHANDPILEVDPSGYNYVALDSFTNEPAYGYDVIDADGLVEKLYRDDEGYIHLGFVRVEESAQIKVTIFDKAKVNDAEHTGNKTTGIWTSRIDRVAPVVTMFDLVPIYEGPQPEDYNNGFALRIAAEDALSGLAPDITDADYNVYTPENIPATGVFATDKSYLYVVTDDNGNVVEKYNSGTFNERQYELPGLQYALIPGNGDLEEVAPWMFETDPSSVYDENGYNGGEMGKPYVWHNYIDDETDIIPAEFDGLVVVRAVDKAGNITVVGYSTILDVEFDDDWNRETQFIQVRTDNKWADGNVVNVQYYGNNNLLFPADMRKDLRNSLFHGEGAIIEVAEQGITNVVITATEKFTDEKTAKAKYDLRNSDWEGKMILGNADATGYHDWKFQLVDVKIDKINPELGFELIDEDGNVVTDNAVTGTLEIKLTNLFDPIPNIPDELEYRSHIPSDIRIVEWCAVPEGSDEEKWMEATDVENGLVGTFDADAFTGTIKVRVTDNAGNVVVKSQRINIDEVKALINLSKSNDDIYSLEPVDVFVTVTENAEFSDVVKVTYEVIDENGDIVEADNLTLIGGTVSVDREGVTIVKVTAETKAGVTDTKEIVVKIDRTAPEYDFDVIDDNDNSVAGGVTNTGVTVVVENIVENGSGVAKVEYAVVPEGTVAQNFAAMTENGGKYTAEFDADAFTGTFMVRVTDVAGLETVKSAKVHIDNVAPIVVISNPTNADDYSTENVDVVASVTANAEYSDVKSVTYTVNGVDMGTLALTGGTISVTEEGVTEIIVTATTKAGVAYPATTKVYIDKTAPTFELVVEDSNGSVEGRATNEDIVIKANAADDDVSGVAKVEYAVIPEGSSEENYVEFGTTSGDHEVEYAVAEALTGTVKVRVTDNAGHVTVKSMKVKVDKKAPLVIISKSNEEDYSKENVNVFVTVTENAEYSDVVSVTYTLNGGAEQKLALTGGTISIVEEGETEIKVIAKTKAGVETPAETVVRIDKTAPTFELAVEDSNGSVEGRATNEDIVIKANAADDAVSGVAKVEYAVIPEGSSEENYAEIAKVSDKYEVTYAVAEALTGTVKVRVTDVAGHVTVKSMKVKVDKKAPLVIISKSNEEDYSKENVNVFVTVTENAEYSDVVSVTYTLNGGAEQKLALTGGTISIVEEGETEIKVIAKTKAGVEAPAETVVRIDKTAPTFELDVWDSNGSVEGTTTNEDIVIKAKNVADSVSGIAKVEYAVLPEGSLEENYAEIAKVSGKYEVTYAVAEALTGTVKVRVTDNAGHVTVKSMKVNVDKKAPLITLTNDSTGKCSSKPVTVFVTATENAEYSDVKSVKYELIKHIDNQDKVVGGGDLPLIGGTIVVTNEGTTKVKVTAETKAGVSQTAETTVTIHYNDLAMPTIKDHVSGDWITGTTPTTKVEVDTAYSFRYSVNGSNWTVVDKAAADKTIELSAGANTIRVQAMENDCLCKSDVNTYVLNYDNGVNGPDVTVMFDSNDAHRWQKESVTVGISANQGDCVASILKIEATLQGNETKKFNFGPYGGNIVIQEEGQWTLEDIIVTMESGDKYIVKSVTVGDRTEFGKVEKYTAQSGNGYNCLVAKIDRTAPEVADGFIEFVETSQDAALFSLSQSGWYTKHIKMSVDTSKVSDNISFASSNNQFTYEYAIVPKGYNGINWTTFNPVKKATSNGQVTNAEQLITVADKAFEGTVYVKVKDAAENEIIVSKTVMTEGIKPEISITYPHGWQTSDVTINVDVMDKGVSSEIERIEYTLTKVKDKDGNVVNEVINNTGVYETNNASANINWAMFNARGGQIAVSESGVYELEVTAYDTAENSDTQTVEVKIDKVAPTYSGSVSLSLYNIHTINNWDDIHDGWTYNHPVDISGITDNLSGVKEIKVKVTTESGAVNETTLTAGQTAAEFSTNGTYELTIIDNAGNVRNIGFVINKSLKNVINVVGVDIFGKVNVAVTDGGEMLTFYSVEDELGARDEKMHANGVTDQLWDGRTGVRYIYGKNDAGKTTNKLHVIVAPSTSYDISLAGLVGAEGNSIAPNRYLDIEEENGTNISVVKVKKIFDPEINEVVDVDSVDELNEDGVYKITTRN